MDSQLNVISPAVIEKVLTKEHLEILAWREVPVDESVVGPIAHKEMPRIEQLFVKVPLKEGDTQQDLNRELFIIYKQVRSLRLWLLVLLHHHAGAVGKKVEDASDGCLKDA